MLFLAKRHAVFRAGNGCARTHVRTVSLSTCCAELQNTLKATVSLRVITAVAVPTVQFSTLMFLAMFWPRYHAGAARSYGAAGMPRGLPLARVERRRSTER